MNPCPSYYKRPNIRPYPFFIKTTAIITLFTFVFSIHSQSASAHPSPAKTPALSSSPLILDQIKVPAKWGTVEETFTASSGNPTVVILQDAHSIPDAQQSLARLIEYFEEHYGIHHVAVEGAASKLDAQIFRSYPDQKKLQEVMKSFEVRGELAGSVAAAIFSHTDAHYFGIEDWDLYEEAIGFYVQAMEKEEELLKQVEGRRRKVEGKKEKTYSKKLLALDKTLGAFQRNETDLVNVMKTLAAIQRPSSAIGLRPSASETLKAFLEEIENEGKDQAALEREVMHSAKRIEHSVQRTAARSALSTRRYAEFQAKKQQFQTSQISAQEFAVYLTTVGASLAPALNHESSSNAGRPQGAPPQLKFSKRLSRLMLTHKTLRDIQGTEFFKAFERYAQFVKELLMTTDAQRKLDEQSRELDLLEKLIKLEMSREEWNEYSVQHIASSGKIIEKEFKTPIAFYGNAENREKAFIKNLEKLWVSRNTPHTARYTLLVAGGFHTEGLTQKFKEQGISYVLITPHLDSIPENNAYRDHMRGEVSWKEYFKVENGKVNLYEAFVRAVRDKLLGFDVGAALRGRPDNQRPYLNSGQAQRPAPTIKTWRDQIIRDLAEKKQIDRAGEYTRFLDEVTLYRQPSTLHRSMAKLDRFVQGLIRLEADHQLTEQNILNLSKLAAAESMAAGTMLLVNEPVIITGTLEIRSEMRNDKKGIGELIIFQAKNWETIKKGGIFFFDVQSTLIARGEKAKPEILEGLAWILSEGIPVVITSGNTIKEIEDQVIGLLRELLRRQGNLELMQKVLVYSATGTVKTFYEKDGTTKTDSAYSADSALPEGTVDLLLEGLKHSLRTTLQTGSSETFQTLMQAIKISHDADRSRYPGVSEYIYPPVNERDSYDPKAYSIQDLRNPENHLRVHAPFPRIDSQTMEGKPSTLSISGLPADYRLAIAKGIREYLLRMHPEKAKEIFRTVKMQPSGKGTLTVTTRDKGLTVEDALSHFNREAAWSLFAGYEIYFNIDPISGEKAEGNDASVFHYKSLNSLKVLALNPKDPAGFDEAQQSRIFYAGKKEKGTLKYFQALRQSIKPPKRPRLADKLKRLTQINLRTFFILLSAGILGMSLMLHDERQENYKDAPSWTLSGLSRTYPMIALDPLENMIEPDQSEMGFAAARAVKNVIFKLMELDAARTPSDAKDSLLLKITDEPRPQDLESDNMLAVPRPVKPALVLEIVEKIKTYPLPQKEKRLEHDLYWMFLYEADIPYERLSEEQQKEWAEILMDFYSSLGKESLSLKDHAEFYEIAKQNYFSEKLPEKIQKPSFKNDPFKFADNQKAYRFMADLFDPPLHFKKVSVGRAVQGFGIGWMTAVFLLFGGRFVPSLIKNQFLKRSEIDAMAASRREARADEISRGRVSRRGFLKTGAAAAGTGIGSSSEKTQQEIPLEKREKNFLKRFENFLRDAFEDETLAKDPKKRSSSLQALINSFAQLKENKEKSGAQHSAIKRAEQELEAFKLKIAEMKRYATDDEFHGGIDSGKIKPGHFILNEMDSGAAEAAITYDLALNDPGHLDLYLRLLDFLDRFGFETSSFNRSTRVSSFSYQYVNNLFNEALNKKNDFSAIAGRVIDTELKNRAVFDAERHKSILIRDGLSPFTEQDVEEYLKAVRAWLNNPQAEIENPKFYFDRQVKERRAAAVQKLLEPRLNNLRQEYGEDFVLPETSLSAEKTLQQIAEESQVQIEFASKKQRINRLMGERIQSRRDQGAWISQEQEEKEFFKGQDLTPQDLEGISAEDYLESMTARYPIPVSRMQSKEVSNVWNLSVMLSKIAAEQNVQLYFLLTPQGKIENLYWIFSKDSEKKHLLSPSQINDLQRKWRLPSMERKYPVQYSLEIPRGISPVAIHRVLSSSDWVQNKPARETKPNLIPIQAEWPIELSDERMISEIIQAILGGTLNLKQAAYIKEQSIQTSAKKFGKALLQTAKQNELMSNEKTAEAVRWLEEFFNSAMAGGNEDAGIIFDAEGQEDSINQAAPILAPYVKVMLVTKKLESEKLKIKGFQLVPKIPQHLSHAIDTNTTAALTDQAGLDQIKTNPRVFGVVLASDNEADRDPNLTFLANLAGALLGIVLSREIISKNELGTKAGTLKASLVAHLLEGTGLTEEVLQSLFKIENGVLEINRAELRVIAEILAHQSLEKAA